MKKYFIITSFLVLSLFALDVNAQQVKPQDSGQAIPKGSLENPFKAGVGDSLPQLFNSIVNKILLPIGSVIAVIAFIYSGFLFVMAQGNESELKTAKASLLYTAIGTAILLGATVLANVITGTINSLK